MWGGRSAGQRRQGATVAELAAQEDCSPWTIWHILAAVQEGGFSSTPKRLTKKVVGALSKAPC